MFIYYSTTISSMLYIYSVLKILWNHSAVKIMTSFSSMVACLYVLSLWTYANVHRFKIGPNHVVNTISMDINYDGGLALSAWRYLVEGVEQPRAGERVGAFSHSLAFSLSLIEYKLFTVLAKHHKSSKILYYNINWW